ncbi:hypothetical protein [Cellvibrio sp. NN19]|uniref:hypothetical protein n=1 Tax=Cellvibrio chitinivorans TaxID=3102792 RepID=UPI002B405671|nr:hypothetical protein [Cellvibrio sp. NN19]
MQLQKKIGLGFILFGVALTLAMYFAIDGGAFLFTALIGLMAIFFGAFQLMITADLAAKPAINRKVKKRH